MTKKKRGDQRAAQRFSAAVMAVKNNEGVRKLAAIPVKRNAPEKARCALRGSERPSSAAESPHCCSERTLEVQEDQMPAAEYLFPSGMMQNEVAYDF